jgi:hypothetical protein
VHLSIVGYQSRTMSRTDSRGAPSWPTGVTDIGGLQISGPSEMVMAGDGRMVNAADIMLHNSSAPANQKGERNGVDDTISSGVTDFSLAKEEAEEDRSRILGYSV